MESYKQGIEPIKSLFSNKDISTSNALHMTNNYLTGLLLIDDSVEKNLAIEYTEKFIKELEDKLCVEDTNCKKKNNLLRDDLIGCNGLNPFSILSASTESRTVMFSNNTKEIK